METVLSFVHMGFLFPFELFIDWEMETTHFSMPSLSLDNFGFTFYRGTFYPNSTVWLYCSVTFADSCMFFTEEHCDEKKYYVRILFQIKLFWYERAPSCGLLDWQSQYFVDWFLIADLSVFNLPRALQKVVFHFI